MRLLLSLFLVILLSPSSVQAAEKNNQSVNSDTIRVISYNIWCGFEWRTHKEREKLFIEYITNEDPEVLALQELCGFTQEQLSKLAKKWGHDYAVIHKEEGYPVGITSKKPITVKEKRTEGYGHGMLHVETYGYDMIVTHLNPGDAKQRLVEASNIVNYMLEKNLTEKTMVMGDFNAHSPFDADFLQEHSVELIKGKKEKNKLNGNFDYSAISRFLSYPLIDVCQTRIDVNQRETCPTLIFWPKDRSFKGRVIERIDFIFVTSDLELDVADVFIPNRGGPDYLSDHYPVVMDIVK